MKISVDVNDKSLPYEYESSFVGQISGCNFHVFDLISTVLQKHPVESIIEFGTYNGVMSMYLGLWGLRLGVPVHTFDIVDLREPVFRVFDALGVVFHQAEIFSDESRLTVEQIHHGKPTYLFCDGGDKEREFFEYGGSVPVGSIISAHDWGTEVETLRGFPHMRIQQERWTEHDARLATVVKIGEPETT